MEKFYCPKCDKIFEAEKGRPWLMGKLAKN
jgi:uncharacterized C2H2 Zn-finger protein